MYFGFQSILSHALLFILSLKTQFFHLSKPIGFLKIYTIFFLHSFLNQCRLMSVSMGNAVKYLKHHITHMPNNLQDYEVSVFVFSLVYFTTSSTLYHIP